MLQRDEFINVINNSIPKDPNIYFLSADFGAAALDKLRKDYKLGRIYYKKQQPSFPFIIY